MAAKSFRETAARQAFSQLVGGGEPEVADLVHGLVLGVERRALGHDQGPDRLHVAVLGLA
jgi:hypothetical protein